MKLIDRIGVDISRRLKLEDAIVWAAKHRLRHIDIQLDTGENALPKFDAVLVEQLPDDGTTPGIEFRKCVFPGVELDVDVAQMVLRRPHDGVLELEAAADVYADAVF